MARIVIELNGTTLLTGVAALLGVGFGFWVEFGKAERVTSARPSAVAETHTAIPVSTTAPPNWHLTFADEFEGTQLDRTKWIDSYPNGARTHSNNEKQYYGKDSYSVHDGFLHLTAQHKAQGGMPYTSGMIASYGKFEQQYGRFEMRAKIPKGRGLWPAFWLLPATGNWPPEVDIMEILGHMPSRIYFSNHWGGKGNDHQHDTGPWNGPDFSKDFHTITLEWSPRMLLWSVDGIEQYRRITHIPNEPMYVIANLAVGGDWPGSPDQSTHFPAEMVIDYIRVYSH